MIKAVYVIIISIISALLETLFITFMIDNVAERLLTIMVLPPDSPFSYTMGGLPLLVYLAYLIPVMTILLGFLYAFIRSVKQEGEANQYSSIF